MRAAASEQRWHVIDALNKRGHSWPESGPEQASVTAEGVPLTIQEAMDKFEISQCRCECNGAGYDTRKSKGTPQYYCCCFLHINRSGLNHTQ